MFRIASICTLVAAVAVACGPSDPQPVGSGSSSTSDAPPEPPTAEALVRDALPRFHAPTPPEVAIDEAEQAAGIIGQRRYDEVIRLLTPIVAEHPDHGRAHLLLGLAHHKQKRYALARPLFERVLEIGPTFERPEAAFYYYGWCMLRLGDVDGATAAFEAFLEFEKDDYDSLFGLGLCALERGEIDAAKELFERSLHQIDTQVRQDPRRQRSLVSSYAKVHASLGDVAILNDDYPTARRHLETCVKAYPQAHEAWFKLSRVYTRLGEPQLAEQAKRYHEQARMAVNSRNAGG